MVSVPQTKIEGLYVFRMEISKKLSQDFTPADVPLPRWTGHSGDRFWFWQVTDSLGFSDWKGKSSDVFKFRDLPFMPSTSFSMQRTEEMYSPGDGRRLATPTHICAAYPTPTFSPHFLKSRPCGSPARNTSVPTPLWRELQTPKPTSIRNRRSVQPGPRRSLQAAFSKAISLSPTPVNEVRWGDTQGAPAAFDAYRLSY